MGNVFLNFHSRVLCMNGLWGGWGPAAGRAGMDAGSQPLRGKDSQGSLVNMLSQVSIWRISDLSVKP